MAKAKPKPTRKPRTKRKFANLAELIRAMPAPDTVTDNQLRQMVLQLVLDCPDASTPDVALKGMKQKLDAMRLLFEMNHTVDKSEDDLSKELLTALGTPRG